MGFKGGTETDLVRAALELLRLRGVPCWRQNGGGAYFGGRYVPFTSSPGISDVVGVMPSGPCRGCIVCLEFKSARGRARPEQEAFLNTITAAGGLAAVVDDVAQLDALLTEWGLT